MIRGRKSKGNTAMFLPKRKRICTKECGYPHSVRSSLIRNRYEFKKVGGNHQIKFSLIPYFTISIHSHTYVNNSTTQTKFSIKVVKTKFLDIAKINEWRPKKLQKKIELIFFLMNFLTSIFDFDTLTIFAKQANRLQNLSSCIHTLTQNLSSH